MKIRPIKKILIANRGEIAVRIIRACKELDICSVALYSEVDRRSLHVQLADEAYALGGITPGESYLNQTRILEIAKQAKVDAIHPGYGFLSENPAFAKKVEDCGLIFIGPSSNSIRLMGDKTEARKIARQLGIPTVAGTVEPITDENAGLEQAMKIGFPILLKAAAGGGGKGMRAVKSPEEFPSSLRSAKAEAKGAFGDERVYMEKYIESPRHIEIQILGDAYGNAVYLGERECSIQRRHQKIIEESPSTAVDAVLRRHLGEAAVALAKTAHYTNAGTLEFLVDSSKNFYFLEMNTRLQVEHPVTEAITGIDLVKEQIRVAEGHPLPFSQGDVQLKGHAIECRICAEDPFNDFFPSSGNLLRYRTPEGRVRVDNGFQAGDEISVYYDSMLAKVITWGTTRDEAISAMKRALEEFEIEGVTTTIPFCLFAMGHPAFKKGEINTHFVSKYFTPDAVRNNDETRNIAAVIFAGLISNGEKATTAPKANGKTKNGTRWKLQKQEYYR